MTANVKAPDCEVIFFINSLYLSREEQEKMTVSNAVYTMCQWTIDDVEYPEGMTPEQLAYWWNHSIDTANKYPDGFTADDSDDI